MKNKIETRRVVADIPREVYRDLRVKLFDSDMSVKKLIENLLIKFVNKGKKK